MYGVPQFVPITEDHPTNPICSYGVIKLAIEKYVLLYNKLYGLNGIILRVANPYGERQRHDSSQGVIPIFLRQALQFKPLQILGDGSAVRDYLYIQDLIDALLASLEYQGSDSLFNIGSGTGLSLLELVGEIEHLLVALDVLLSSAVSLTSLLIFFQFKKQRTLFLGPLLYQLEGLSRQKIIHNYYLFTPLHASVFVHILASLQLSELVFLLHAK